jgi:PEP-CTERM motif
MRIDARAFLMRYVLAPLLAVVVLVPGAFAGGVSVSFSGTVTGELSGKTYPGNVNTGDAITNSSSFSYLASDATYDALTHVYTFSGVNEGFSLTVSTSGTPSKWTDGYNYPDTPDAFTIKMAVSGATTTMTMTIDTYGGTAEAGSKTDAYVTLVLTSTTYTGGTALPEAASSGVATDLTINAFFLTTASLTWDPGGPGGGGGQGFGGTINEFNGQSVPEPSSFVLMGVATAAGGVGLAVSRQRRRARAASE